MQQRVIVVVSSNVIATTVVVVCSDGQLAQHTLTGLERLCE